MTCRNCSRNPGAPGWQWVAYHGDERIGFADSDVTLCQRCLARGLDWDQFVVRSIEPEELPHATDAFLDV